MRTAVVNIGTNSTRLLIADVAPDGEVAEIVRRSVVTRLGAGVDAGGESRRRAVSGCTPRLPSFARRSMRTDRAMVMTAA